MGHTPGPWHYIGDEDGDFMILAGEADDFVANIGSPIQAVSTKPSELVAFDVDQANARLIAAAPLMLETLQAIQRSMIPWNIRQQIGAVIDHATGKES